MIAVLCRFMGGVLGLQAPWMGEDLKPEITSRRIDQNVHGPAGDLDPVCQECAQGSQNAHSEGVVISPHGTLNAAAAGGDTDCATLKEALRGARTNPGGW